MKKFIRKLDFENGHVDMTHGSGGRAMAQMIDEMFAKAFENEILSEGNDQARLDVPNMEGHPVRLAFSTDSFVISPLFFPGGNIGSLAVHGTVNDVALSGAKPLWLSVGFILEEGFPLKDLQTIVTSMAKAASEAKVQIVTGDTKVVEKGKADGVFINTAGIGALNPKHDLSTARIQPGDAILLSGSLGDHGVAIMAKREGLQFDEQIESDHAALHFMIADMMDAGADVHAMRDPTRGGLATALNEMAQAANVGMQIKEDFLPIKQSVKGVCEILGLDPLYVANEGKLIAFCPKDQALGLLNVMKKHKVGQDAAIIGEVTKDENSFVEMETAFGGRRMVDWLVGEQLPRIC